MNLSFVLERKKRLQSRVLQALAGLFPGASPIGGLLSICVFFVVDPHPRRFLPALHCPITSPPTSSSPSRGAQGIGPTGTRASRTSRGTADLGIAVGWEADIHRYTCAFDFSGQGGFGRRPPPSSPHPLQPEANIAGLRIFIGWTRWDLRIGFGADYHCLGIITVVIFILPKGERQKETKTPNNQPQKTCGIYLT